MKPKNECEADRAKVQAMDARDKAVKAMRRAREAQDKVDADRVGGNLCNNC